MVCHLQVREYKNVINRWVRSKRNQDISYYSSSLSRVVLAALMGVGVVAHVYLNTPSPKWLIYMTDQVRFFLKSWEKLFPGHHLVSYPLCSPCIAGPLGKVQVVVELILWLQSLFQATKVGRSDPSFPLQALLGSWGGVWEFYAHYLRIEPIFQNMVSTIALLISVLYWTLLHPEVVKYGFLKVMIITHPRIIRIVSDNLSPIKGLWNFHNFSTNFWMCWFCPQAHWPI